MRMMLKLGLSGAGLLSLAAITFIVALLLGRGQAAGSNPFNGQDVLFSVLLFGGVILSLMGAGIFIYLGVYRWQRAKPASE